jgi:hypothetical protein
MTPSSDDVSVLRAGLLQLEGEQFFLGSCQMFTVASAGLAFFDPHLKRPRFDLLFEVVLVLFHLILLILLRV